MANISDCMKRMIRVNQAGEYGATRIYAGQIAVLKGKPVGDILRQMAEEEKGHLQKFNRLVIEHEVRPTLLQPLWHSGGYILGVVTALLGEKAAHACTIAVEEVIEDHYQQQLEILRSAADDTSQLSPDRLPAKHLVDLIEQCQADEINHKETAIESGGREALAFKALSQAIRTVSRAAIWLSSRI